MEKASNKSTVQRRYKILEELERKAKVSVKELSKAFNTSEVTIRNDLEHLERQGMLTRSRGGAIKVHSYGTDTETSIADRLKDYLPEKERIAKAAIRLIEDNDTIVLDSGSTTTEIAKNLNEFKNLTIITNDLNIAIILSDYNRFNIIMPGGMLRKKSLSLAGVLADENIVRFYCDKLFLGADGFDTSHGLSTLNSEEAHLNKMMISMAKKVIVVADSRKFQRRRFTSISPVADVNVVITDSGISEGDKSMLMKHGVTVIIA